MQANINTYDLRKGRRVTFTWNGAGLSAEWEPEMPTGKLGRKLLPDYKAARNQFLSELAPYLGTMLVVDL